MERMTNGMYNPDPGSSSAYQPYNVAAAIPHHPHPSFLHQVPPMPNMPTMPNIPNIVKLEASSSIPMQSYPVMPPTGRSGVVKYCGVCGDIAKSYHFGGLSCDSCKAFFRRSVQNDNYLHFQCCHRGQCVISLSNRKSCQYCRMKRCFAIGMEKSWVMTEEERKALMKARAEKKLSKQLAASATSITTTGRSIYGYSSMDDPGPSGSDYEPQIERMVDFLAPVEIKEIEAIVTKYMHAYQHVPYRTELRFSDSDRPGVQVMEMFGTLIRRFAFYARLMADFSSLPFQDQSCLLKGGVLEMCVLRGALVYDPLKNRWPNANMSMYKDAPVLKLGNIGHMTSSRIFHMHMEFINCIQQMGVDEPTIMLLVLIVLFTPERAGLIRANWIEKYQAYYTSLLERYMSWRFGMPRSKFMFSKLLTKLSDLRELSEIHTSHNLQLGSDEISSIQHQLQHLKINPYPECKVVPEDPVTTTTNIPDASAACASASTSYSCQARQQPYYNSSTQSYYPTVSSTTDPTQQQPLLRSCASEQVDFKSSSSVPRQQQFPPQQQLYGSAMQQVDARPNHPSHQYTDHPGLQPSSSAYTSYPGGDNSPTTMEQKQYQYQEAYRDGGQQQQQQQQEQYPAGTANMAMQFMQAMQQSVQQVINAPHFGFEWVKPDYQFDMVSDDDILETLISPTTQSTSIPSVEDPSSPDSKSSSSSSSVSSDIASSAEPGAAAALSPRTMEELYDAIEEYSELYG